MAFQTKQTKRLLANNTELLRRYAYAVCGEKNLEFIDTHVLPRLADMVKRKGYENGIILCACTKADDVRVDGDEVINAQCKAQIRACIACADRVVLDIDGNPVDNRLTLGRVIWFCCSYILQMGEAQYF